MPILVIVGLGNPGAGYARSRHNIGFRVVDSLAGRYSAEWKKDRQVSKAETAKIKIEDHGITLLKPMDYMNNSGKVVGAWCRYHRIEAPSVAVVHDDITMETGRSKISLEGGAGGHNGVADLYQHFGRGFVRFRVGIGGKSHPDMDLADYVLGKFSEEEENWIESRLPYFSDALISLVKTGPITTMNQFNQRKFPNECNDE